MYPGCKHTGNIVVKTIGIPNDLLTKEDIKQEDLDIYLDLFRRNTALNKELINLAKEGIITKLVIGQDDGEDFGIPNMEKKKSYKLCAFFGV